MWKNKTTPNLILQQCNNSLPCPKANQGNVAILSDLSFADTEPLQKMNSSVPDDSNRDLLQFQSKSSISYESRNSKNQISELSFKMNKKLSKENLIVMELQQNQELRMNLFRAGKTIQNLDDLCKDMQKGILQILALKKQQMIAKLNQRPKQMRNPENSLNKKAKIKLNQNDKQNFSDSTLIEKQSEITQIWKKCYADLLDYINNYSKDITFLTEQYKALEEKKQLYKKSSRKSKKNEENLLKILKQSCAKLERSEQTIQKALEDLKERDNRIQEYQIQNKNIKMKILDNLDEIQKLKRENKMQLRDCASYKQVAKSLQDQISDYQNKCRSLQQKIENKQKLEQIYKDNEQALKQRIQGLEEELCETKRFNENLMDEYKKLSSKIQQNQQKISQKYQASQIMHEQQTKQYQKFINTLQRQKDLIMQKYQNKIKMLQQQIQKAFTIKASLERELSERSLSILHMQQQKTKLQQKNANIQFDLSIRIEQKDRQIAYLEQLRTISNNKNEELKQQLDQVRGDMVLIIEQLKVKELQIEKYISNPNINKQADLTPTEVNRKNRTCLIDSLFYRQLQNDIEDQDEGGEEGKGIVWRKIKKQKESTLFQQNTDQLAGDQKILSYEDNNLSGRTNKFLGTLNNKTKNLAIDENPSSVIKLTNRSGSFSDFRPNQEGKQSNARDTPTETVNSPKNKFSLQAFQNKLVLEESAKLFLQFNKTMFK